MTTEREIESTTETNGARDTRHDARMIADLRAWRATVGARKDQTVIGIEELDALLAAADELDTLKLEATAEKTTSPDGRTLWEPSRAPINGYVYDVCSHCGGSIYRFVTAVEWNHAGDYAARYHVAIPRA